MGTFVLSVWYDREGDSIEVTFEDAEGYLRQAEDDHVMARVDLEERIIGFVINDVSTLSDAPLAVTLRT